MGLKGHCFEEMTNQQYLLSGFAGQTYHESDISSKLNRNHRAFLRIDYRPDSKNRIMFRPNLSFQNNDSESKLSGETFKYLDPLNSTINDYYSQSKGYNISSDLLYMHAFEKTGRSISLNISGSLNNRDGETSLYAISDYYALESMETDSIDQISNNITEGSSISGRIMYTEPLSEFSVLQFNYDYSVRSNDADQTTFNLDPMNSVYELIDTLLSSKFLNTNYSQGIGTGYRYRKESMMFMASVNYRRTNLLSNEEFPISSEDEYDFHSILPMLMLNLELGSNRNLRFMLRTRSDVPSISQLQTVVDNSNPLQLSTGNPSLEPDVSNSFTLRYSSANIEKSSMFYAGFRANISRNEISNSSFIASGDTIINGISLANGSKLIIPVNLDGSWSMNLFSTYGIPVNPIKCNLNFTASVNLSKKPGLVNGETGHSLDRSGTVGYALVSNISSNIDFTISSNATYNNPISSFNTMLSEAYFYLFSRVKFKWILEKGWFLDTQFSHSLYNGLSEDYDQSFALWNIGAGKKIFRNQRGELSIKFYDALNQNTSISRTVSDSYISDMETNVIERYFLLSFRYDLRRMGF